MNRSKIFFSFILYALIILPTNSICGQGSNFTAGIIAGLNASQIDGDALAGFNKVGLSVGLRGGFPLSDKFDMNVEFLYSERGSRPDLFNPLLDPDINISLKYAEIPVYVQLSDWLMDDYYKVKVHAGLSYGRLISATSFDQYDIDLIDLEDVADQFNQNDFSWIIGGSYFFSRKLGITLRYTRYINSLLNPQKIGINAPKLKSYFFTFRFDYNL